MEYLAGLVGYVVVAVVVAVVLNKVSDGEEEMAVGVAIVWPLMVPILILGAFLFWIVKVGGDEMG